MPHPALQPPEYAPIALRRTDLALKRLLDVSAALAGLLLCLPLLLLIAGAIRLDSPGPVLFRQRRIGRHQRPFWILKFRTMKVDTPDLPTDQMLKLPSPVTRIGAWLRRTSLDELPQLFNVLIGEMSLVGPRPALYNQDSLIALREATGIHALLPGITGWAQINGRDELPDADKVAHDRVYLERFSFFFDLKILWGTARALLSQRGAF